MILPTEHYIPEGFDGPPAWKVEAYKWNLEFSQADITTDGAGATRDFASVIHDGKLWRWSDGILESYSLPDLERETVKVFPYERKLGFEPSLVSGEDGYLHIFAITDTGILYTKTNDGETFSAWTEILTMSAVRRVAAASPTRVHYVRRVPAKRLFHFGCLEYDSGWNDIGSDIYWQYPVQSLTATPLPDGSADCVIFVSQVPGLVSMRYEDQKVVKTMEPSGGILGFVYRKRIWSDHINVDILDRLTNFNFCRYAKVHAINGQLYLTALTATGTAESAVTMYRVYTCKDGRYWSMGRGLYLPSPSMFGVHLHQHGDKVYAVQGQNIYEADSTLYTGHAAPSTQVDITNDVAEMTLSQNEGATLTLKLNNSHLNYIDHPIISAANSIVLMLYNGHYLTLPTKLLSPAYVLTGIFHVDDLEIQYDGAEKYVAMSARDRFAWMADTTQSEQARYWKSQLAAGDDFADDPKTKSGGMAHTAIQSGAWTTRNRRLLIKTRNEESTAFSTFDTYLWNGAHQASFKLTTRRKNEYAGLVFRAVDKDNLWLLYYNEATDTIRLAKRVGGVETVVESYPNVGWSTGNGRRWLRVHFRYGRIKAYHSDDGVNWTTTFIVLVDGQPIDTTGIVELDQGYVGYIGKGFSREDRKPRVIVDDEEIEEQPFPPIEWAVPDPDVGYPVDSGVENDPEPEDGSGFYNTLAVTWADSGHAAWTSGFNQIKPVWNKLAVPAGDVLHATWDWHSTYITGSGEGELGVWLAAKTGTTLYIYNIPDLLADTISIDQKHTVALTGINDAKVFVSRNNSGDIYVFYGTNTSRHVSVSLDNGDTWEDIELDDWTIESISGDVNAVLDGSNYLVYESSEVDEEGDGTGRRVLRYRTQTNDDPGDDLISHEDGISADSPILLAKAGNDAVYAAFHRYVPKIQYTFDAVDAPAGESSNDYTGYAWMMLAKDGYVAVPNVLVGARATSGVSSGVNSSMVHFLHEDSGEFEFDGTYILSDQQTRRILADGNIFRFGASWLESAGEGPHGTVTIYLEYVYTDATTHRDTQEFVIVQGADISVTSTATPGKRVAQIKFGAYGVINSSIGSILMVSRPSPYMYENDNGVWQIQRINNYRTSPTWTNISPSFESVSGSAARAVTPANHGEVHAIASNPDNPAQLAVMVGSATTDRIALFITLNSGAIWTYVGDEGEASGIYMTRRKRVVAFGDDTLADIYPADRDRQGDLDLKITMTSVRGIITL